MHRPLEGVLLLTDMDGTLIEAPSPISARNVDAIARFNALGGMFTIATGRSFCTIVNYTHAIELTAPSLHFNGGLIYDNARQEVLWERTLPEVAKDYVADILAAFPEIGCELMYRELNFNCAQSYETDRHIRNEQIIHERGPLSAFAPRWNKVLFGMSPDVKARVVAHIAGQSYPGVQFVSTSRVFYEMVPEGSNKGEGLRVLADDILHLPRGDIYAIGDYHNDIEMMDAAGHAAAAGNAPDEVKAHCDLVVCDVHDGAVADYIDWIIATRG